MIVCRTLAATFVALAFGSRTFAATVAGIASPGAVVWASPVGAAAPPSPPQEAEVRNINRSFDPALLVLPVGSSVRFSNEDPYFHSIFSASEADPFDLGFYSQGPGKSVSFPSAGVISLRCHIHRLMRGFIIVVDGPVTRGDLRSGAFAFAGLAAGSYVIHAWDPQTETQQSTPLLLPRNAPSVTLSQPLRP